MFQKLINFIEQSGYRNIIIASVLLFIFAVVLIYMVRSVMKTDEKE
jgi:hypothetical protein